MVMVRKRVYFAAGAAWLFLFLCFVQGVILLCLPRYHIPIWAAIYPTKAEAGGWLGLNAEKLLYLFIGIGNYFSGGQNSTDYRFSLQGIFLKIDYSLVGILSGYRKWSRLRSEPRASVSDVRYVR
jgi:hypothetical protein